MRWFLICLVWNLTRTAFSFPDDFNLFSGQAGPATASLLNDDLDEISGINGSDFDETFLGDDPAFNGVLPEDITFDASPAGLDTFTTLSSDPLGCLSSISRIRRRAGACSTVVEEPTQVDEDTTVADSLTRNGDIIVDQEQAAVQAVPDVTLAQNLPVNRDPPVTADESLFADMSVFQDKPIDQNTLALSDDKVVQGPTLVAQDAPVDPDEPVLEDVLPVIQDVSVEPGLLFNEDLSLDRAARVDSIQKYWCSADYGLGIDKIPVCNIDADSFNSDQLSNLSFRDFWLKVWQNTLTEGL